MRHEELGNINLNARTTVRRGGIDLVELFVLKKESRRGETAS